MPDYARARRRPSHYVQELCGLAKHLQAGNRSQMLGKLADLGLFRIMTEAMERRDDVRTSPPLLPARPLS